MMQNKGDLERLDNLLWQAWLLGLGSLVTSGCTIAELSCLA